MITREQARQTFLEARRALRAIVRDDESDDRQIDEALLALDVATIMYLRSIEADFEARIVEFQGFIDEMNGVIASLKGGPMLDGIKTL